MIDPAVLQTRLTEAQEALHRLTTGQMEASVQYDGFQSTYTQANINELRAYIADLERQLGLTPSGRRRGLKVCF